MNQEEMAYHSIYAPKRLINALEALAKADSRNFNNYVCLVLEAHADAAEAKAAKLANKTTRVAAQPAQVQS